MHIRIKITLLFTVVMFVLLSILCGMIYYFSYASRKTSISAQLTDLALTTSSMLYQPGASNDRLMHMNDSNTVLAVKNRTVQVYNKRNENIYTYYETARVKISNAILDKARIKSPLYFSDEGRDVILYYDANNEVVILAAGIDEQGKTNLQRLRVVIGISLIGGMLIAFASGYFFSRLLLQPVKKMADEVNSISAQNLAHRIKTSGTADEWNYLAETLNELLNRLQESFEIQRRFISSASHELSTPLTSISSQLEVSLQRERSAADYRQVMQSVYQDVRHLSKLTQTLLEFASVSGNAGGIELNLVRIDEVLMRLPGEVTKINKEYAVKIGFDRLPEDEASLLVFGSAELLFTAVKNIVSNACKYSVNRLARVTLSTERSEIVIAVEDDGKGIPENELQNIFQPFYRTADSRSITGFGLGLPLVNRIVKLHKGHISVQSVVGKGTIFFIHLPMARQFGQ